MVHKGDLIHISFISRSIIVMLIHVMMPLNQCHLREKYIFSILDDTVFDADSIFMWILVLYIISLNFQQNIIVVCSCVKVDNPKIKKTIKRQKRVSVSRFICILGYDRSSLQKSESETNCPDTNLCRHLWIRTLFTFSTLSNLYLLASSTSSK